MHPRYSRYLSLLFFFPNVLTAECFDILSPNAWYIMPKIGIAPGVYTHRDFERRVVPLGSTANPAIVCTNITGLGSRPVVQENLANTIVQQNKCRIPRFSDMFSRAVLDVGFEIGRTMCDINQLYVEFYYNHAKGLCKNLPTENVAAPDGCSGSCTFAQSSTVLTTSNPTYQFSNYTAYGGYIGNRYYHRKRYVCDRVALWAGFKVGILHRKQVTACITVPERTATVNSIVYTFEQTTLPIRNIFCSSNAVSGGLSFGGDYRLFECLSVLLGVDILASCPLAANPNAQHVLVDDPTGTPAIPSGFFVQPTNTFPGGTGVVLQIPVWLGLRWEWGFKAC